MSDIVKNRVNNITFQFPLKGDDYKNESTLARDVSIWLSSNDAKELEEFILRHINYYANNGYQDVLLKDFPSAISKVDYVFKEPLTLIKKLKDEHNRIGNHIRNFEKNIDKYRIEIKNNMIQIQMQKQREFISLQNKEKEERINFANNLTIDTGLDEDQIADEQVRAMEDVSEIDKNLDKAVNKFRKEKLLIKDIEILGIDDNFLENANKYELIQLIKKYLTIDEKIVKNTVKAQWDTNTDNKVVGIKGINIKIKGVK